MGRYARYLFEPPAGNLRSIALACLFVYLSVRFVYNDGGTWFTVCFLAASIVYLAMNLVVAVRRFAHRNAKTS